MHPMLLFWHYYAFGDAFFSVDPNGSFLNGILLFAIANTNRRSSPTNNRDKINKTKGLFTTRGKVLNFGDTSEISIVP